MSTGAVSTGDAAGSVPRDVPASGGRGAPASGTAAEVPVFCGQCGGRLDEALHDRCRQRAVLEPPRYCTHCRRRMVVQVMPTGWWATCVQHGVTSGNGEHPPRIA